MLNDNTPFSIFNQWYKEAIEKVIDLPNAFALATASSEGIPSVRMLLLKYFDEKGFVFFTNYNSLKGKHIFENPQGSMLFYWKELKRQVRINGIIKKISKKESNEYFKERPFGSKVSSWASQQSQIIPNREFLLERYREIFEKFKNSEIPCPRYWGGYILKPYYFEFWKEANDRLHERNCFELINGKWVKFVLAP